MDGIDVMDGALTNPFAHAVATALAVAGADTIDSVHDIELELYRANDIESDDTSSARIHLVDGTVIAVTVSLCADRRHEPYLLVHGEKGPARLFYTVDEIEVDGMRTGHSRTDLLDNLVGHVLDDEELLVPLERTGAFTRFVDAVRLASPPQAIPEELQRVEPERRVLPGIAGLAVRSAERLALLSELGFPRARAAADWPETTLHAGDREVATYVQRGDLQATAAPRPYLHPVRTLAGTVVTETQPDDHVHHLGAGVAISDLDGVNFWGGSTYVPGQGPTILPNHGRQRRRLLRPVSGGFVEELDWVGPDGIVRVSEERTIATRLVEGAWALDFGFTLTNRTSAPLSVQSSACKGRVGAGYGGFFWRAPKNSAELAVFTAEAEGEQAAHGSRSRWLALVSDAWSLLFIQNDTIDPWFVRVAEYPGVGPALAWDAPLPLDRELFRSITVVVADGRLTPAQASHLAIGGSS